MKIFNYTQFNESLSEESYQELFIKKLKVKFPNGLNLYHITTNDNIESIMEDGLMVDFGSKINVIHTVLGTYNISRLSSTSEGLSVISIDIPVSDYNTLFPEEQTYYTDYMDDYDGDERDDYMFKEYMEEHTDFIGGDITLYDNISAEQLTIIEKNGVKI